MLSRILTEEQEELLAEQRRLLGDLRVTLARLDTAPEDQSTLEQSILQLDELFLLVVVGEFNAGKSVFINALLGEPILEEGVTPTTQRIFLLKYGDEPDRQAVDGSTEIITAPVELLQEINIVDTPGTNAIHREHEAITRDFVPRSDLVLFVTSADRPFTESERIFLESIRDWGKKIVVVVNKIDILESETDLAQVVDFVAQNFHKLLAVAPEIFPVSAKDALRAKVSNDHPLLNRSGFETLEEFITSTLDETERIRLKLLSPIGVASRLTDKYLEVVDQRLELLKEDFRTLEEIEQQLALYEEDRSREFRYRKADIDNVLLDFEARGMAFFEETMRLARVVDLVNKSKVKNDFEHKVVADLPQVIEKRVDEVIDWMVASELKEWQAVVDHLEARRAQHVDRIVGQVGGTFDFDRQRLLETVGRSARRAVESYDRDKESTRLAESVQMAVAGAALLEVGAVGLGTLVTMIASTSAADVTGILAAGALSVIGLLIIPARRRKAKQELRRKVGEVREQLMNALTSQFEREMSQSLSRIQEAIAPYTRFVRAERDRLGNVRAELGGLRKSLDGLKAQVSSLGR
jgi:small GTP-binding protein